MTPRLLIAAHGTRSAAGSATTRALAAAIAAARPQVPVGLCFLDVAAPSLSAALDAPGAAPAVVVPLLLSAGYHVLTDIPAAVAGRPDVRVARHLGPDPSVVAAVADRLAEQHPAPGATVALAAIASSRAPARAEVELAAARLGARLGTTVAVLPLTAGLADAVAALPRPVAIAVHLLAEGGFLSSLRDAVAGRGVVAAPIGVHPALVSLVWARYDEAVTAVR